MTNLAISSPIVQHTNESFLRGIYGARWKYVHTCGFPGDPFTDARWGGGYTGHRLGKLERADWNNYYVVSLFKAAGRRGDDFAGLFVVMVDDVGTKVTEARARALLPPPSYRTETSPGNEQWGFVLDMPELDRGRAEALTAILVRHGLAIDSKDPGMRGVCRYARLPVGANGKAAYGGQFAVSQAQPLDAMLRYTPEEIVAGCGEALPAPGGPRAARSAPSAADMAGDVVFQAMQDLGWVKGRTGNGWGWEVTCPYVADHTGALDNGTAYQPGPHGHWMCNHGHCAGRTFGSFYAGVAEALVAAGLPSMPAREFGAVDPAQEDATGYASAKLRSPREDFLADHVFLKPDDAFYSLRARAVYPRRSVNSVAGPVLHRELAYVDDKGKDRMVPADKWFFDQADAQIADGMAYRPGQPLVFQDNGLTYVNEYRAPDLVLRQVPVTKPEIAVWLDLVRHVLGGEGARAVVRFLDWCAAVVSVPDLKPGWMLCVQGTQGIGKDMMMRPVVVGVGAENTATIKGHELTAAFNEYASRRLVLISELKQTTSGAATGHDQYNALKTLVDTSAVRVWVNPKYGRKYFAEDTCAVFTSTNEMSAIALESDDRRVMVFMSRAAKLPKVQYAAIVGWLDAGGSMLVVQWLRERWARMGLERRGTLKGNAPDTVSKRRMFLAGDPVRAWVGDRIDDAGPDWPDIMPAHDIMGAITRAADNAASGLPHRTRVPSADRVGRMLADLGCKQLAGGQPVRLRDGRRVRLWSLRSHAKYVTLGGAALAALVDNPNSGFTGSQVIPHDFQETPGTNAVTDPKGS